jgi:predicted DNA-binding transcriptional regulator AlpA
MQPQSKVDERAAERRPEIAATLANLPSDLGRNRVLDAATSSAFWGVSLPHWRRLYRAGKVPQPVKVGERKLGWRIGVLADALAARDNETATACVR